jgi:hypothetical protein
MSAPFLLIGSYGEGRRAAPGQTEQTRESLSTWIGGAKLKPDDYLFSSRLRSSPHVSTRQYARIVRRWVQGIGLNPAAYATHTMRRTKAALIYRRTKTCASRNSC